MSQLASSSPRTVGSIAIFVVAIALLSVALAMFAGPNPLNLHVFGVGIGLALFLIPDLTHWKALEVPKAGWILGILAVVGLNGIMMAYPDSARICDSGGYLCLAGLVLATVSINQKPLNLGMRTGLVCLWVGLLFGMRYGPHFKGFLLGLPLSLLLLWKYKWRKTSLVLAIAVMAIFGWTLYAGSVHFYRLKSYWIGNDPIGRDFMINLARQTILRAWPLGEFSFNDISSLPAILHREYVLASVARAFGWPAVVMVVSGFLIFYRHLFRTATQHAGTIEGELLWGLGQFMALMTGASFAHLLWLQPWVTPLPLLGLEPTLAVLFLATAGLWVKLARRPCEPSVTLTAEEGLS